MALKFEVPAQPLRDFGLAMKIGPITAIQVNSPAATADIKVGDVIESVDGKPAGESGGWTPDSLPDLMRQAAEQNREVESVVLRSTTSDVDPEKVTVKITPRTPTMYYSGVTLGTPQGVRRWELRISVTNEVQAITADGPASKTNIKAGDKIVKSKDRISERQKRRNGKAAT